MADAKWTGDGLDSGEGRYQVWHANDILGVAALFRISATEDWSDTKERRTTWTIGKG